MQTEGISIFMQLMGVLFVIFLAYIGTKWLSKKHMKMSNGNHMKVLERIPLGQDKSIVLVSVGKKTYLLGVSAKGIETLQDFGEEEFAQEQKSNFEKTDLMALFNDFSKKCNNFGGSVGQSMGNAIKDFYIKNGRNGL